MPLIALIIVIIVAFSISTVSSSNFRFRKSKIIALFQDEPYAPANICFILFNKHSSNHLIIEQS